MRAFQNPILAFALLLVLTSASMGRTIYVDFDNGSDDRDGSSPELAIKHAPGDKAGAAGKASAIKLQPGDTVLFKGGVFYRGSIDVNASGKPGEPITYDGNTAGTYGKGKAIIDGSQPIENWTRCATIEDARGNPNWKSIYFAEVPATTTIFSINLVQGEHLLAVSRDPNPTDPFSPDELTSMHIVHAPQPVNDPKSKSTSYADAKVFSQSDKDAWAGAYMAAWLKPNRVYYYPVTAFDPSDHKITVQMFKFDQYGAEKGKFAMINAIGAIDRAGEYYLAPAANGTRRIYVWPIDSGANGPADITYSVREHGVVIDKQSNVVIQGFLIQKQSGAVANALHASGSQEIVYRQNDVRFLDSDNRAGAVGASTSQHILIDGNFVHHNRKVRGIAASQCEDLTVTNNTLEKNGGTGIAFFTIKHGKIAGNNVSDHAGVHANALTVYANSSDIVVERNHVTTSRDGLTLQDSENLLIQNNIFEKSIGSSGISIWTGKLRNTRILNNLLFRSKEEGAADYLAGIFTNAKDIEGLVVQNNILDGVSAGLEGQHFDHNLYMMIGRSQSKKLGEGEILESDLSKIFVDPAKGDYHLKPGSPAIGSGADVGVETDFAGKPRPKGARQDMGPLHAE